MFITMVGTSAIWIGLGAVGYWTVVNQTPPYGNSLDQTDKLMLGEVINVRILARYDDKEELIGDTLKV